MNDIDAKLIAQEALVAAPGSLVIFMIDMNVVSDGNRIERALTSVFKNEHPEVCLHSFEELLMDPQHLHCHFKNIRQRAQERSELHVVFTRSRGNYPVHSNFGLVLADIAIRVTDDCFEICKHRSSPNTVICFNVAHEITREPLWIRRGLFMLRSSIQNYVSRAALIAWARNPTRQRRQRVIMEAAKRTGLPVRICKKVFNRRKPIERMRNFIQSITE